MGSRAWLAMVGVVGLAACVDRALLLPAQNAPVDAAQPIDAAVFDGAHAFRDAAQPVDFAPNAPNDASSAPDLAQPPPVLARLIAPLSTSMVTQQRPTLHWTLDGASSVSTVDLCRDRACGTPIAIHVTIAADGLSGKPDSALPYGWVFWRVRTGSGADTLTSPVWQLWVGHRSASTAIDSSTGTVCDVNGDGFADFVVGDSGKNLAHVFFGGGGWSTFPSITLTTPSMNAQAFGASVACVGDVNGDGFDDVLVGDWTIARIYLYFGGSKVNSTTWNASTTTTRIDLGVDHPGFGYQIVALGDVDGDGYGEFLVSRTVGPPTLYRGSATPSATDWSTAASANHLDLVSPQTDPSVVFGASTASVGDVNGDGYADFLIGAPTNSSIYPGAWVYLYYGGPITAAAWNGAMPTRRVEYDAPSWPNPALVGGWGLTEGGAGDVNGDGYADFVIADVFENVVYLFTGGASPSAGVLISGFNDFGWSIAPAGDVNGDGYADFLIGEADDEILTNIGAATLFLGGATVDGSAWTDSTRAFHIASPDGDNGYFSFTMVAVGDENGTGFGEFAIGAWGANNNSGAVHLYRGESPIVDTDYSGDAAVSRWDLIGPDGASAYFGHLH